MVRRVADVRGYPHSVCRHAYEGCHLVREDVGEAMRSFRSRPVGWRGESHRHYLAAKGVTTRRYAASMVLRSSDEMTLGQQVKNLLRPLEGDDRNVFVRDRRGRVVHEPEFISLSELRRNEDSDMDVDSGGLLRVEDVKITDGPVFPKRNMFVVRD
jgi:hypothetical protein